MKVVWCWAGISGYMGACCRALADAGRRDGSLDLHVLAFKSGGVNTAFKDDVVSGFSCRLLDQNEAHDDRLVASLVRDAKPDILVLAGWFHRPYVRLAYDPELKHVKRVMGMDTHLRMEPMAMLRQIVARFWLRRYLKRMDRIVVPGERGWLYARFLGIPPQKIVRGLYAADCRPLTPVYEQRLREPGGWPKRFLFIGRYVSMKGVDVLMDAYRQYRAAVPDPWPLACGGQGPLEKLITGDGVENLSFLQPTDFPAVMARHGVFICPSRIDPWGVVLAEAGAAGLPIICSDTVGASAEMLRPYHNGLTVPPADAQALARAMKWMHEHYQQLPQMGAAGQHLADAYTAEMWSVRWHEMFKALCP